MLSEEPVVPLGGDLPGEVGVRGDDRFSVVLLCKAGQLSRLLLGERGSQGARPTNCP